MTVALLVSGLAWGAPPVARVAPPSKKSPAVPAAVLHRVSADSMRANLSFLASDALEGRETPSRGLDVAAEFIASRFRGMGLQTAPGADSYFQVANWRVQQIPLERTTAFISLGERRIVIEPEEIGTSRLEGLQLAAKPVFKATLAGASKLKDLAEGSLAGSVVLIETVQFDVARRMPAEERSELERKYHSAYQAIERLKPDAVIGVRRASSRGAGASAHLIDPQAEKEHPAPGQRVGYHIHSRAIMALYDDLPEGSTAAKLTLRIPDAVERPVALKNVAGVLPGSDPILKDSYVIVTAHYDHVGRGGEVDGDSIFNGANDDASGVASLIEVAGALAGSKPRRTIVFIALFGEEKGLYGSYYYTRHPLFPLEKTVADLNLEHMGRTDDSEGSQAGKLSMTGYDYSEVKAVFEAAAKHTGVEFYKREKQSDSFFNRSDNAAFAEAGVPAHTFTVAFDFPDYHALTDHWDKIDYDNMAKVNRTVVAGIWELANRAQGPAWNSSNEKTEKYRAARTAGNKSVQ